MSRKVQTSDTTKMFGITDDDLMDGRWGDMKAVFGPFIVTERGIFTDFFGEELFFYYDPVRYSREACIRKRHVWVGEKSEDELHIDIKTHKFPLKLGDKINPHNGPYHRAEFQEYFADFHKAIEYAKESEYVH